MTPPHWKQAQNRTIKLHEFQVYILFCTTIAFFSYFVINLNVSCDQAFEFRSKSKRPITWNFEFLLTSDPKVNHKLQNISLIHILFQQIEKDRMKKEEVQKKHEPERKRKFEEYPDKGKVNNESANNTDNFLNPEDPAEAEGKENNQFGDKDVEDKVSRRQNVNRNLRNGNSFFDKGDSRFRDERSGRRNSYRNRFSSRDSRDRGRRFVGRRSRSRDRRRSRDRDRNRERRFSRDRRRRYESPRRRDSYRQRRSSRDSPRKSSPRRDGSKRESSKRDSPRNLNKRANNRKSRSSERRQENANYDKSKEKKENHASDPLTQPKFGHKSRSSSASSRHSWT